MDNKTIFARTSKGEDEMHSRTSHLAGDVKRALLMVDGNATLGEISKRAAPSMRASLSEMLQELEKGGFIKEKVKDDANVQSQTKARGDNIPKMSVPVKMATPKIQQPVNDEVGELDFMSGFAASSAEVQSDGAGQAEKLREEAEEKSRQEIDARKMQAQQEAEAILHKAEQEAARIREETARRAKAEAEVTRLNAEQEAKLRLVAAARERQQAEAVRLKAEQEASKVRDQLNAAKLQAEQETRLRLEAAAREQQQAEAALIKAEQEAAQMRIELEMAKMRAELEAKARLEATTKAHERIKVEEEAAKVREEAERNIKKEQDARAREAASKLAAQSSAAAPAEKPGAFAFDSFQVDKPLYTSESHLGKQSAQKDKQPAQKVSPVKSTPAEKPGAFTFDSFQVDKPLYTSESRIEKPPTQQTGTTQLPAPAAKAAQPEPAQRPVKQKQVPPPVENETVDGKPSPEQIQRAMQERKEVEERMAAEALEAKKMAEAQAKAWSEAEQRAIEAARSESEQAAKQAKYTVVADTDTDTYTPVARQAPIARVRRKPFSWGRLVGFVFKLGLLLLVLLAGALFVIPYVTPMRDYMPKAEQMLSAKLHQPVHIGRLTGRILPMPRLELGEVYIGDAKQFQADSAQINFSLMGLFTEEKPVSSIEFQSVKVRGAWLRNVTQWLQQMANEEKYPVSRMVISQGKLDADIFELTGIEGELDFDPTGKFTQTNLRANAGKYALGINATLEGKLQVNITVRGSALPLLPNWTFDDLTAKGELNNNELVISDFDAKLSGGSLQGNANINWRSGWRAQGTLTAKAINMQQLNRLLEGNLEGSARFKMSSTDLIGLADSAVLDGSFISHDGTISGMDIVETARMRSRENLPGGRTRFDGLSGTISYSNNEYHFKQVKVAAGVLNATATFDVTKQQLLSGKMNVNLSMQDVAGPVDLQMGGTIDSPTLRYAP